VIGKNGSSDYADEKEKVFMRHLRKQIVNAMAAAYILLAALSANADAVSDWNTNMVNTVAAENPFAQARFAAITQLAVFEAVNACTAQYRPYLGTINAPAGASAEAAAVTAAHGVLKFYFPGATVSLDAAQARSLAQIPNGQAKDDGVVVGDAAAAAMIALRANDGSVPSETLVPSTMDPGVWQPTPPAFGPGILLQWRNVTPFGIRSSQQFRSDPPPLLTSSRYTRSYREVREVGDINSTQRPQDRADVARYFAVASAAQVWNSVAQQISAARNRSLSEKAHAFALLNMAVSDGLVSSMETKYFYIFWRPVTAIRAGDTDANPRTDPDPAFTPFITTPSFPSYPSAHASASYAAREILEKLFGCWNHSITLSNPGIPDVVLHYTNLENITDDIDDARVYGGIHFRFDQEAGAHQGRHVGTFVFKHNLLPLHDDKHVQRSRERDEGQ
jgi:hypothetical protein